MLRLPPRSTLFPYTRSSDLRVYGLASVMAGEMVEFTKTKIRGLAFNLEESSVAVIILDRKSTRLNSSHLGISYAVFCLKKKNKHKTSRGHSRVRAFRSTS